MFTMLTSNKYEEGINTLEKVKYNINYCKEPLFDIVLAGFVDKLLNHEYSSELTEEQINLLSNLK